MHSATQHYGSCADAAYRWTGIFIIDNDGRKPLFPAHCFSLLFMDLAQDTFTTLTVYLSEQLAYTELQAEVSALLFGQEN